MADTRNIKLVLAYDGSAYRGWQRQSSAPTVQGVLEAALKRILSEAVTVIGSGRTDAGVHALAQTCHFITHTKLPVETLRRALNALLPQDVFIREATDAPAEFHARYAARSKIYEYRIWNREEPDLFARNTLWQIRAPLNRERMAEALSFLPGTHDFAAFRSAGSGNRNPVRTVSQARLTDGEQGVLAIRLEADGFLRHMVRNIVGTLVRVGLGKLDPVEFAEILRSRDRQKAEVKAPPQGLFLVAVRYSSSGSEGPRED